MRPRGTLGSLLSHGSLNGRAETRHRPLPAAAPESRRTRRGEPRSPPLDRHPPGLGEAPEPSSARSDLLGLALPPLARLAVYTTDTNALPARQPTSRSSLCQLTSRRMTLGGAHRPQRLSKDSASLSGLPIYPPIAGRSGEVSSGQGDLIDRHNPSPGSDSAGPGKKLRPLGDLRHRRDARARRQVPSSCASSASSTSFVVKIPRLVVAVRRLTQTRAAAFDP